MINKKDMIPLIMVVIVVIIQWLPWFLNNRYNGSDGFWIEIESNGYKDYNSYNGS